MHWRCYVPARLLLVFWLLIGSRLRLLAVELLFTEGNSCPSQYLYGTIFMIMCFIVWDWNMALDNKMLREEPVNSLLAVYLLFLFVFYYFIFFSFFHWLVVWGWGLQIHSVHILSQPCIADSFFITIITFFFCHFVLFYYYCPP